MKVAVTALHQIVPERAKPVFIFFCRRSSGPVSYGYSELENNNQTAIITTPGVEFGVQTPNVEYSMSSIKNEMVQVN